MSSPRSEAERLAASDYELKFVARRPRAEPVCRWLRAICPPDPRFPICTVFTVYYDTSALSSLNEKRNSDYLKTKVRLRWYRVGGSFSEMAFLEIKSRFGSRRDKDRLRLPFREAWPAHGSLDGTSLQVVPHALRRAGMGISNDYRPVLLVRYERRRFIEPTSGMRVALDTDICVPAVSRAARLVPRSLPLPTSVFELKGTRDHLPERLRSLPSFGFRKSSFSKYRACYDYALAPGAVTGKS